MPSRALRRRTPLAIPSLAAILALSPAALAQPAKPKPGPVVPAPAPGLVVPAPAAVAPIIAVPPPPPIELNDPMLVPVPQAGKVLTDWKQALNLILARSTNLATALQEVERAEGNARIALAAALPTITGTVNVTGQLITTAVPANPGFTYMGKQVIPATVAYTSPNPNPTVIGALTVSQPILAPRAWYGIRTGEMGVTSSKLSVEDQKRTIFTSVASSIITVFTTERTAEINRQGLKSALSVVDLTIRQNKLGTATKLDVLRAQQSAATARATLVSGDEALLEAREALGLALGFPEAYGVPAQLSLPEIESTVRGVCAPSPLDDRADIKAAKNNIEIAKRGITDAWLQFSPTASLNTTASIANSGTATVVGSSPSGHDGSWTISGVLTLPIWDGGVRYGNLRIAKVNAEEAKITLEAALRTANIQIMQALRAVAVAEREHVVSVESRDLAKRSRQPHQGLLPARHRHQLRPGRTPSRPGAPPSST